MATALEFPAEDLKEADIAEWKELVSTERCWRCGGLMVTEQCFDLLSDSDATSRRSTASRRLAAQFNRTSA